jgi:hypothetical protein
VLAIAFDNPSLGCRPCGPQLPLPVTCFLSPLPGQRLRPTRFGHLPDHFPVKLNLLQFRQRLRHLPQTINARPDNR